MLEFTILYSLVGLIMCAGQKNPIENWVVSLFFVAFGPIILAVVVGLWFISRHDPN